MPPHPIDLVRMEAIFNSVLALPQGPERSRSLDDACGHDAELRRRVEALLASSASAATGSGSHRGCGP